MPWINVPLWQNMPGVHRSRPDPYCIWAELTNWVDYPGPELPAPPRPPWIVRVLCCIWGRITGHPYEEGCAPDPTDRKGRAVIIELINDQQGTFELFIARAGLEIRVPEIYSPVTRRTKYITARVTSLGMAALADTRAGQAGELVARFDLCDFGIPRRFAPMDEQVGRQPPVLTGTKLIGIVDDGCAFAHASFVRAAANNSLTTRVAALWDQDVSPIFGRDEFGDEYGELPGKFGYGRRIFRTYVGVPPEGVAPVRRGLDEWIAKYRIGATSSIDEERCYAAAHYTSMRRRVSHGAHVMDVLAGPRKVRDRIYVDRTTPPTWSDAADPASNTSQSDLIFVQLPRAGLQDTSGGWLDAHVLEAVRCILDWRGAGIQQTVISLSYGSSVGPHDDSPIFVEALDEVLRVEKAANRPTDVVMATGNSFGTRGHAVVDLNANQTGSFTWRVPPSSESPGFLQIWLPCDASALPNDVEIRVTAPGSGQAAAVCRDQVQALYSGAQPNAVIAFLASPSRGRHAMALLALSPTMDQSATPGPVAMHGDWTIEVKAGAANLGCVHAYIAVNEKRMAGRLRGRQSHFVDASPRYLQEPKDDPALTPGAVRRRGTLNGISCGTEPIVTAGYSRQFSDNPSDGIHADYSSAGMSADPLRGRCPTAAFPTDESHTLRGIRAAGTRSGSTFRLVGTSSAAPQRARAILAGTAAPAPAGDDVDLFGTEGRWPL
jgi:hypothetical protein